MQYTTETYYKWLEKIEKEGKELTPWEENFIESITEYLMKHGFLSKKQEEILEKIYAEKTPNG